MQNANANKRGIFPGLSALRGLKRPEGRAPIDDIPWGGERFSFSWGRRRGRGRAFQPDLSRPWPLCGKVSSHPPPV